jgi:hypothetical protein
MTPSNLKQIADDIDDVDDTLEGVGGGGQMENKLTGVVTVVA